MALDSVLDRFLPPVREWFFETLGAPTPPQRLGWPAIAAGQNALILAPTGSGKTLAAFLACLDSLWRQPDVTPGVRVLYISPLKALNNDIYRNLQLPLEGVAATAERMGVSLPKLEVAVRTGDTPAAERQRQARRPAHILITTPESLHLLLTSRARDTLRGVKHVIVDEIHALCSNKRGVFLALLLERLAALQTGPGFVRIGLSATQRPLEEIARYLGGQCEDADGAWRPRPVTIIDAGQRKDLDLCVVSPTQHFAPLPGPSAWPSIYRLLAEEVRQHRSTIIFANNRRTVERVTAFLNEDEVLSRAHHGSVALEMRQGIEADLKEGRLPAVVATASLELGIDMGSVDLVCQVESPGSVARGLQRVGRAGHLVGQRSKGRLIPKTLPDLLEQAALAREMAAGRVEETRVPTNCLDILAQQLVAMAAMDAWNVPELFAVVRRAHPFRDLTPQAFETTLEMISGRYVFAPADASANGESLPGPRPSQLQALQPRVSWDRVHNRVLALPGSQQLALVSGGSIPDTGQFAVYHGKVRLGELDEEFVWERRIGDVFMLGTNAWRLERIEADRVVVTSAQGVPAIVPFWHGESAGRTYDLGCALGAFVRELQDRLQRPDCDDWLAREHLLDRQAAANLRQFVNRQLLTTGCLPTDRTLVIEASRDQLGDWQVLFLSPFGHKLHLALRFAIEASLRQRLGYMPQCIHHSDGILIRQTDSDEPIMDLLADVTPENVESLIVEALADSALFALRFRQNAARALLLPRGQPGKRAPLWLQRLRGKDLLQVARRHADFPIIVETFRECLNDYLDMPHLRQLLEDVRAGHVRVVTRRAEAPSPFAAALVFSFNMDQMYQYDSVRAEGNGQALDRQLLEQLVAPHRQDHLLDPRAVQQVERRLRGVGRPPRSAAEMAEWLRRLGDVTAADLEGPMAEFLAELEADGRAVRLSLPATALDRWVAAESADDYGRAFGMVACEPGAARAAGARILDRFLATHVLVGLADVLARYPFDAGWAERQLTDWARTGRAVQVTDGEQPARWSAPENLQQAQRGSLAMRRREIFACTPRQFADFLLRWQGVHPAARMDTSHNLGEVLDRLEGLPLPAELWEQTVLPSRIAGYLPRSLDEWSANGTGVWVGQGDSDGPLSIAFFRRESLASVQAASNSEAPLSVEAGQLLELLRSQGAMFLTDLASRSGLVPSAVRAGLAALARASLVTNDRFDVVRRGGLTVSTTTPNDEFRGALRPSRIIRPRPPQRPEGRWSLLSWGMPGPEEQAVFQAAMLLRRYGVAARELALMDAWLLPWRVLYEVLSRMELTGDVLRGYFVEGLSGAQFALREAAQGLQEVDMPATASAPVILLHSQDPANLYGAGAPFDIPLLEGGTRPFLRRPGNWLVLRAGRPVLLVEQQGRKITALASASRDDVVTAAAVLPNILDRGTSRGSRHKITVEEWNGQPVSSVADKELLEAAGFVPDYQGMTLYAGFR